MTRSRIVSSIAIAIWLVTQPALAQIKGFRFDLPHYFDPEIILVDANVQFHPDLAALWIKALESDEAEMKERAAFAFGWSAQRGMKEAKSALPALIANLSDKRARVRVAAARALSILDDKSAAKSLAAAAESSSLEMAQVVEPVLARWKYEPFAERWRSRLRKPIDSQSRTVLAMRGAAALNLAEVKPELLKLVGDRSAAPVIRLEAASNVAVFYGDDVLRRAQALRQASRLGELTAAKMLRHAEESAKDELLLLAKSKENGAAIEALWRLTELNPDWVLPIAKVKIAEGDSLVRRIVCQALVERPNHPDSIRLLCARLDDAHPVNRNYVRESLFKLCEDEKLKGQIIAESRQYLTGGWRGIEQAVRLQTDLDQKDNAARFVELLTHERAEVYIAAAWGLRQLAVEDSLADVLKVAIQRYDSASTSGTALEIDEQISHLCYYFGQHAYKPAVPFLTRFIPKSYDLVISRATAIWAFGVIYKGDPNRQIADQLIGRLNDVNPQVPETPSVRRFSALTLARMNARFALPALREFRDLEGVNSEVGQACAYAIKMLTGEDFELPKPAISYYQNFFLEPLPRN